MCRRLWFPHLKSASFASSTRMRFTSSRWSRKENLAFNGQEINYLLKACFTDRGIVDAGTDFIHSTKLSSLSTCRHYTQKSPVVTNVYDDCQQKGRQIYVEVYTHASDKIEKLGDENRDDLVEEPTRHSLSSTNFESATSSWKMPEHNDVKRGLQPTIASNSPCWNYLQLYTVILLYVRIPSEPTAIRAFRIINIL